MKPKIFFGAAKSNGNRPIYINLRVEKERFKIPVGVSVHPDNWDIKNLVIKGKDKSVSDDNLVIQKCLSRINTILVKYRLNNRDISAKQFRAEYSNPSYDTDFFPWLAAEIKIKGKGEVTKGRVAIYKVVENKLKEFRPGLCFSEIDHDFINEFKGWLKTKKNNDVNTICSNLKVFKSFTTRALRKKLIEKDPFLDIKIGAGSVDRVFLNASELRRFWLVYQNEDLVLNSTYTRVLRHYLFMCFTGLRISDFKALCFENVVNDILFYYPIKTRNQKKQLVKVPLNQYSKQLIEDEGNQEGHIFRCITDQKMNEYIKDIAIDCGVNKSPYNHSARHTFSTLFLSKTSDVATLQKLLGHSRIAETMQYVHVNEENIVKKMAEFSSQIDFN